MAINLTENVKTYLTYAGIAINSAAVGALILLAGQGINNRLHPKVSASAITGDLVRATRGKEQELQAQLDTLNRRTQTLTEARNAAQRIVDDAGEGATEEQRQDLARKDEALRNHNAQLNAQTEALSAQIANERAVATLIGNDSQLAILVNRINQIPVSQAQVQAQVQAQAQAQVQAQTQVQTQAQEQTAAAAAAAAPAATTNP